MWWKNVARCLSVSSLVWMLTLCVQLTATLISDNVRNMWLIYFAAAAFQVLVVLWYLYRYIRKKNGGAGKVKADQIEELKSDDAVISDDQESDAD